MKNPKLSVKTNSVTPALDLGFEMDCYTGQQVPIVFEGTLSAYGKIVGRINSGTTSQGKINLQQGQPSHFRETVFFQCDVTLSRESVSFIHDTRDNSSTKDVRFQIEVHFKHFALTGNSVSIVFSKEFVECIIPSSDWLTNFCPGLGVGTYSTLEVNHSGVLNSKLDPFGSSFGSDLRETNAACMRGDWIAAIHSARDFFERARMLKGQIESYSEKTVGSPEYATDLKALLEASFQLLSKYQHTHSRRKEELNLPVTKSDAQMALYLVMAASSILEKLGRNGA